MKFLGRLLITTHQVGGSATGASDPKVGIIDAATGTLIQMIKTDNITAHAVAVDLKTNKMVIALAGKGIAIYDFVNGTATSTTASTTVTASATASASPKASIAASAATKMDGCWVSILVVAAAAAGSLVA
jgi:hypothetical protein